MYDGFISHGGSIHLDHNAVQRRVDMIASELSAKDAEIERLRQGLWDCALAVGMDGDGNDTSRSLAGDIVNLTLDCVREHRKDYDDLLDELKPVATARRDAISECVKAVRAKGQQWYGDAKKRGAAFSDKGRVAELLVMELESLLNDKEKKNG